MDIPTGPSSQNNEDLPPAGWYADPSGEGGIRWWTGSMWAPRPRAATATRQLLRPPATWFSESLQAWKNSGSDLFALVAVCILPPFLALALAMWNGFREFALLVRVNQDTQAVSLIESRGGAQLADGAPYIFAALAAVWVGTMILIFASSIQVVQAGIKRPATWLQSLQPLVERKTGVGTVLAISAVLTGWLGYTVSGQLPSGVVILLAPFLLGVLALFIVKFSFAPTAAALGDPDVSPFIQSVHVVKGHNVAAIRRFGFLVTWAFVAVLGLLFVVRLIIGGSSEDPALAGTADRYLYRFAGAFGDNVYLWMLVMVIVGLFWGALISIWSGASALLYKEMGGRCDVADHPLVESEPEH